MTAVHVFAWTKVDGASRRSGKKSLKQFLWIAFALWTGFTFVGYFVPIRTLGSELLALQGGWQIFWVLFYGFATYGNAGYLREQICKYMCPYARFQSAMFDKDTLIVSYDAQRGEQRGPARKMWTTRRKDWVTALTASCVYRSALWVLISATACSTSALAAACASMHATA